MNAPTIGTEDVRKMLDSGKDIVLLNVLPEVYFKKEHIPGSLNVDGYKMDFIPELEKAGIRKDTAIVVYASGADSEASTYAAQRMLKHGWSKVMDYREGIAGWKQSGLSLQAAVEAVSATRRKNTYLVDASQSVVHWSGRNMNSIHTGTLKIKEGSIGFAGNESMTGQIVLDMDSISNTDLADPAWNQMLVAHLKSEDFFDVAQYPVARIAITRCERLAEPGSGVPNFRLTADLSIKGVTRETAFPASVVVEEDGTLKAHAHFDFDRTLWNVKYGSAKFFKQLGMHLVDDLVSLDLKIVAQ